MTKKNILEQASVLKPNDYYNTPPEFWQALLNFLGLQEFDVDPCAPMVRLSNITVPANIQFTEFQNGLIQSWKHPDRDITHVFVNPPYSNYEPWVVKAIDEALKDPSVYVWMLLNQSNSQFWQDIINPLMKFRINTRSRVSFYLDGVQQKNNRYDQSIIHFAQRDNYLQYLENNPKQFPINGLLIKPAIRLGVIE